MVGGAVSAVTHIRGTHPYTFRSGQWAEILTTAPNPEGSDCYIVRFPDGVTDFWCVEDPAEPYEFAPPPESEEDAE